MTLFRIADLMNIGSDNGLSSDRRQSITLATAELVSIGLLWRNFSEIEINVTMFSFTKMYLKMVHLQNLGHMTQASECAERIRNAAPRHNGTWWSTGTSLSTNWNRMIVKFMGLIIFWILILLVKLYHLKCPIDIASSRRFSRVRSYTRIKQIHQQSRTIVVEKNIMIWIRLNSCYIWI